MNLRNCFSKAHKQQGGDDGLEPHRSLPYIPRCFSTREPVMRAETADHIEQIKQSLALLRRSL